MKELIIMMEFILHMVGISSTKKQPTKISDHKILVDKDGYASTNFEHPKVRQAMRNLMIELDEAKKNYTDKA